MTPPDETEDEKRKRGVEVIDRFLRANPCAACGLPFGLLEQTDWSRDGRRVHHVCPEVSP